MVAHARREYLPTDRALPLSIGRPNSLAAGAFSVGNISNTPRHKSGYYGICLLGITIRKFLSLCVNFATYFIDCACLCRLLYIQVGNRVGSRGAASPPGPTILRKRSVIGPPNRGPPHPKKPVEGLEQARHVVIGAEQVRADSQRADAQAGVDVLGRQRLAQAIGPAPRRAQTDEVIDPARAVGTVRPRSAAPAATASVSGRRVSEIATGVQASSWRSGAA